MEKGNGLSESDLRLSLPGALSLPGKAPLTASEIQIVREASVARARSVAAAADCSMVLIAKERSIALSNKSREALDAARDALLRAVCEYALLLKQLDTSPERTLRLLKETVTEGAARPKPETLMDDAVRWCVESYYGSRVP